MKNSNIIKLMKILLYASIAILCWFLSVYFKHLPVNDSLIFNEINGPSYFIDAISTTIKGNFILYYTKSDYPDCMLSHTHGNYSSSESLVSLSEKSGFAIVAIDKNNVVQYTSNIDTATKVVYMRYYDSMPDSYNKCNGNYIQRDGRMLLFELGTKDSLIEYHDTLYFVFVIMTGIFILLAITKLPIW